MFFLKARRTALQNSQEKVTMKTLPPNQQLVASGKWPIIGEKAPAARDPEKPLQLSISGLVTHPMSWTEAELRSMEQEERVVDIHCVTRWSKLGAKFIGISLKNLLKTCQPTVEAKFISFVARSERNHSSSLALAHALELDVFIALDYEGAPLVEIHGGPIRSIVPDRYFYKSVKWLQEIHLLEEDELGFWEKESGYHNHADPWKEERYIVSNLDAKEYNLLLKKRDFSDKEFLGIRAEQLNLDDLSAKRAQLRDGHFEKTSLRNADFQESNLSNAHFQGADLRGVNFREADLEGANFQGADLRGADFTNAKIFGVTFCSPTEKENLPDSCNPNDAILDQTTVLLQESMENLTPLQLSFVEENLQTKVQS